MQDYLELAQLATSVEALDASHAPPVKENVRDAVRFSKVACFRDLILGLVQSLHGDPNLVWRPFKRTNGGVGSHQINSMKTEQQGRGHNYKSAT